jgi:hypothetical protein
MSRCFYVRSQTCEKRLLAVHPHRRTRFTLDGFWWKLIFELFWGGGGRKSVLKTYLHFCEYLDEFIEWELFQIRVVENNKTRFMFGNFLSENCAVYEKMSKNMVEPERPQMAIWRRVACLISKATRARSHTEICNTDCFPTATVVSQTRLNVCYTYISCVVCVNLNDKGMIPSCVSCNTSAAVVFNISPS